jgi:glutathione S-transferase
MSTIKLFSARACPFAHRSRLVLSEKKLAFELVEIDLQNKPSWFESVSGYGKVPALEHDGDRVWESAVINEYLEEAYPEPQLLPSERGRRAQARIWIDYANTRLAPAFGALLRSQSKQDQSSHQRELTSSLAYLEGEGFAKLSGEGPFFLGARPSLVDFAFYPWFERWPALEHYRGFAVPAELTRLHRWQRALRELDSVKAHENPVEYYVERYARHAAPAQPEKKPAAWNGGKHQEKREIP